jgi:thiosulfate dehydrogenase
VGAIRYSLCISVLASLGACGRTQKPPAKTTVQLCDGHTEVEVAQTPTTREGGQEIADSLMAQWRRQHPDQTWESKVRQAHRIVPPADNSEILRGAGQEGVVYGRYTARDLLIWNREAERLVAEGARVFHDADELGSTIAVSCDMCHPDAANTHPETYPKFQVQMGRVALLRDMINWCLEHPVRAEPLAPDDPRMRAMEAYITAQRSGTALNYGKH